MLCVLARAGALERGRVARAREERGLRRRAGAHQRLPRGLSRRGVARGADPRHRSGVRPQDDATRVRVLPQPANRGHLDGPDEHSVTSCK